MNITNLNRSNTNNVCYTSGIIVLLLTFEFHVVRNLYIFQYFVFCFKLWIYSCKILHYTLNIIQNCSIDLAISIIYNNF